MTKTKNKEFESFIFFKELRKRIMFNKNIEEDSDVWGEVFVTNSREEVVSFIEYGYDFLFE